MEITFNSSLYLNDLVDDELRFQVDTVEFSGLTDAVNVDVRVFRIPSSGLNFELNNRYVLQFRQSRKPGGPRNLVAKGRSRIVMDEMMMEATETYINLSWDEPSDYGTYTITDYKIEVTTDAGLNWTVLEANAGGLFYNHVGLTSGDTRHYRVSANSQSGTAPPSNVAFATVENSTARLDAAQIAIASGTTTTSILLTFDEVVDATSVPAATAFPVKVNGSSREVTAAAVFPPFGFSAYVQLDLSPPVRPGDVVTVSYVQPLENPLKDTGSLEVQGFTDFAVTNDLPNTAPEAPRNVGTNVEVSPARLGATAGAFYLHWREPYDGNDAITKYQFRTRQQGGTFGSWTDIALTSVIEQGGKKLFYVPAGFGGNYTLLRNLTSQTGSTWEVTYDIEMRAVNGVGNGTAVAATMSTVAWWFELELLDSSIEEGETGRVRIHVKHDNPDGPARFDGFGTQFTVNWSATDASYVTPSSGTATFAANQRFVDVSLRAVDDSLSGEDQTVDFELTGTDQGSKMPVGNPKPKVQFEVINDDLPPPPPTGLTATPGPGEGKATLSWTNPTDEHGNTATSGQYRVREDGGMTWNPDWTDIRELTGNLDSMGNPLTQVASAPTSVTVGDAVNPAPLDSSTVYVFEVRGSNDHGDGEEARIEGMSQGPPAAPGNLEAESSTTPQS